MGSTNGCAVFHKEVRRLDKDQRYCALIGSDTSTAMADCSYGQAKSEENTSKLEAVKLYLEYAMLREREK